MVSRISAISIIPKSPLFQQSNTIKVVDDLGNLDNSTVSQSGVREKTKDSAEFEINAIENDMAMSSDPANMSSIATALKQRL